MREVKFLIYTLMNIRVFRVYDAVHIGTYTHQHLGLGCFIFRKEKGQEL
jgi:hypothetical protein